MTDVPLYAVGDRVSKVSGDYYFDGTVVAGFYKLSGYAYRYVVEDARGLLFIFSGRQLDLVEKAADVAARKAAHAELLAASHERTTFPRRPRISDHIDEVELPRE